jgi:endonuclease I
MKKNLLVVLLLIIGIALKAQIPDGYYNSASGLSQEALKKALYNIIKGQTEYPYTASTTDVWDILKETDRDPANPQNVILFYTGWSVNAAQEYNNAQGWTREHVWAKSRGDFGTDPGPGTDCHHLRPVDNAVNTMRNNRWFAECSEAYILNGVNTGCFYSSTQWTWEPRAAVKGDVARMIFYMATRYEGENGEPNLEVIDYLPADNYTNEPIHALLSDLLKWNAEDPVDDFERNRNEVVYKYQHNRNPFIDHPEYVYAIWGGDPGTATLPTSPNDLKIVTTPTNLQLKWSDVAAETNYQIFRSEDASNYTLLATPAADVTTYTDATAQFGKKYYYYILAENSAGLSESINIATVNYQYASDLLFTEYIEGTSYNKALEVSNFTATSLDLSHYTIKKQTNGAGDWSIGLPLSGTINFGQSFVIAYIDADPAITSVANITTTQGELNFNGNDPISLWKDGQLIDQIGNLNSTDDYAADVTLIRKQDVQNPSTTYNTNEWYRKPTDDFSDISIVWYGGFVACAVPNELNYIFDGQNAVTLSWCNCTLSSTYSLRYKPTSSENWTTTSTADHSLKIENLGYNTEYEFQVAATCNGLTSDYSPSEKFTTYVQGIEKQGAVKETIYPNPAQNDIYVRNIGQAQMEIYTIDGKLVLRPQLISGHADISSLAKGIYIVRFIKENTISYGKLMKE